MIGLRLEIGYGGAQPLPAYNPATLFSGGQQGAWYDPSDFTSMFQDTAGTVPVTATGQAVARINDKSGRGNHATQATAAARPVLQQDAGGKYYLAFDGVDDNLATASISFTATDKLTAFLGVRKTSDAAVGQVLELSATITANAGAFSFPSAPGGNDYGTGLSGSTGFTTVSSGAFPAPVTNVITGVFDINVASDKSKIRVNAVERATSGATAIGSGNFGNYPLYIGSRAGTSLFFNGRMYSVIVRGAASAAQEIIDAETHVNSKTGAY